MTDQLPTKNANKLFDTVKSAKANKRSFYKLMFFTICLYQVGILQTDDKCILLLCFILIKTIAYRQPISKNKLFCFKNR